MIYLDYSANTPADPEVIARFAHVESTLFGNPNSHHVLGYAAREEIDRSTERIASVLGVSPAEIIYTSGASEANNLAIKGTSRIQRHVGRHIVSTPLEHSSVSGSLTALQEQGWEIELCDVRRDGKLDLESLECLIRDDTVLVCISAVDSELGVIQPVKEISELVRRHPKCRLHVDATQAVGKIPVSFDGVDTMSLTGHKFYGLNGAGLLIKRRSVAIEPLISGGESTTIYRSGTPTAALDSSLALALEKAVQLQPERSESVKHLSEMLRLELASRPGVVINSPADAIAHILNLSVTGIKATAFQRALSEHGVCVSVKSACSSDGMPSRAVFAVSRDRKNSLSSWRISLSHLTSESELNEFLKIFDECRLALSR